jgi:hypothetical protein
MSKQACQLVDNVSFTNYPIANILILMQTKQSRNRLPPRSTKVTPLATSPVYQSEPAPSIEELEESAALYMQNSSIDDLFKFMPGFNLPPSSATSDIGFNVDVKVSARALL